MLIETQKINFLEPNSKISKKKKQSFCETFIYEPENIEELCLGNLYLLGKLDNTQKDLGHLINLLSVIIKREYYKSPQNGALKSLEQSLRVTNQHLANLAQEGNLAWLNKLSFLGIAICQNQIYFTQAGKACGFLFRDRHLVDITKKLIPSPEKPHPQRIFQNVISGKIEPEDLIVIATKELTDTISPRGLRQIFCSCVGLPLDSISQKIEMVFREKRSHSLGAALLIKTKLEQEQKINPSDKNFITPPINLDELLK